PSCFLTSPISPVPGGAWSGDGAVAGALGAGVELGVAAARVPAGRIHTGSAGSFGSTSLGRGVAWICRVVSCACSQSCPGTKHNALSNEVETIPRTALLRRCIVSRLGIYIQMRQALGRNQLDLDLTPMAIFRLVGWTIAEHILVAQLNANLGSDVGELVGIVDRKHSAAGNLADIGIGRAHL